MAEPIRILRITTRMNIGGPSRHVAILSTQLDSERFAACLVLGEPDAMEGDLSGLVAGRGARVIRLRMLRRPLHPWRDAIAFWRLLRIVWKERPRIIHTHLAKAGALGRLAGILYNHVGPGRAPEARAMLVHTFHGHVLEGYFNPWLSQALSAVERWLGRRTDRLIAVSPAIREELLKRAIGSPERIRVIPLGLQLEPFAAMEPAASSGAFRCGLIGRLVPIKHPRLFLEGLVRLTKRLPSVPVRGVIVGDGPLRSELEAQARTMGLQDAVQFTGWRHEVSACYRELDTVCVTSWNEGTPVSLIEAMAAGRAVVATDVGGVRDLLAMERGSSVPAGSFLATPVGLLIRAGDVAGLAAALERLATDAVWRRTLGEEARAHVLRTYTHRRLLRDMERLYSEMVGGPAQEPRIGGDGGENHAMSADAVCVKAL